MPPNNGVASDAGIRTWVAIFMAFLPISAWASEAVVDEPDGATYRFVSHYSTQIEAPPNVVWKHLVDLGSWMYEFEMSHVAGAARAEGEVLRLYAGQDFLVQIIKRVPNRLLVLANLPLMFRDEFSTGIGVMTLHGSQGITTVDLTMSRRYTWHGEGPNPVKALRASAEFSERTRAMWQDRFLGRLRTLAEEDHSR